jgi:peptide/nickel transport system ATP-binding protein
MSPLLDLQHLGIEFTRYCRGFSREAVTALRDVTLQVHAGEVLGVIGESGAGKSVLAAALLGVLPRNARITGLMYFQGRPLRPHIECGRNIALVPQSIAYLDPMATVGAQLSWAAKRASAVVRPDETLGKFGLASGVARMYPHELSGGMARRVLIAMATVGNPRLIIADEPTTGLDPENSGISLHWLKRLAENGAAVMLISHDIGAVLGVANRIAVFRDSSLAGIEDARNFDDTGSLLGCNYARALWQALPRNGFKVEEPV